MARVPPGAEGEQIAEAEPAPARRRGCGRHARPV